MFLYTKNHYQFRMTPFFAKFVVVGCSAAKINRTGYVSAGSYKEYHFDFPNSVKVHNNHQEAVSNVKFAGLWRN